MIENLLWGGTLLLVVMLMVFVDIKREGHHRSHPSRLQIPEDQPDQSTIRKGSTRN
ncbi:hypothetical protein [Halobacillus kuroshimensis]|uniref:hypothetical protein n=1 Tax=Halobacillus kuroshimensis TaxID=302481 RepID=UPI00040862C3|nr:hypothetical protein [Halobacillus kuroshimensis]